MADREIGKFYRGAWIEDDPEIVHTLTIKQNPKYDEKLPWNPVVSLDGIQLKALKRVSIEIAEFKWVEVTMVMTAKVDLEMPLVKLLDGENINAE
jgi:hypothetical protein